jgi:DNA-binding response OmpR family regulator
LVIEDATDHAALVRVAARRAFPGLDVRVAGDGGEGIAYLEGTIPFQDRGFHPYPDLVILDLLMPGIDGFGVLERIRARKDPRRLPVVVLTASRKEEHARRALELGAVELYLKPDSLEELGEMVKDIVRAWMPAPAASVEPQSAR